MSTKTRFEEEAKGTSEMAYYRKEKQPNTVRADRRMSHLPNDRELQTQIP